MSNLGHACLQEQQTELTSKTFVNPSKNSVNPSKNKEKKKKNDDCNMFCGTRKSMKKVMWLVFLGHFKKINLHGELIFTTSSMHKIEKFKNV